MVVVRWFDLVLNDHNAVAAKVVHEQIKREWADRRLLKLQLEIHAEHVTQGVKVLGEPRRELLCFVRPQVPQISALEDAELLLHHGDLRIRR